MVPISLRGVPTLMHRHLDGDARRECMRTYIIVTRCCESVGKSREIIHRWRNPRSRLINNSIARSAGGGNFKRDSANGDLTVNKINYRRLFISRHEKIPRTITMCPNVWGFIRPRRDSSGLYFKPILNPRLYLAPRSLGVWD